MDNINIGTQISAISEWEKYGIRGAKNHLILELMHEDNFNTTKFVLHSSIEKYLAK
jgi:hypothetical protein